MKHRPFSAAGLSSDASYGITGTGALDFAGLGSPTVLRHADRVTFSQPVLVHDLLEYLQHGHVALVKLLDGLHERRDVLKLIVTSQSVADQLDVALARRVISLVPVVLDRRLNRLLNILVAHVARPVRWKASSIYRSVVLSGSNPQMLSFYP